MREYVKKLQFIACCLGMLALAACKDPNFFQALGEKIVTDTLSIMPSSVTVPVNGTVTFGVSGGVQPYTYSVLPARVGAINPTNGAYTAPTTLGTETVRVTDHKGRTADANVTIAGTTGALSIQPASVSINVGGIITFVATGGSPPYNYNYTMQTSASGPPAPSVVAGTGVYTAGNSGSTVDVVRVSDGVTFKDATITVTATNSPVNYDISAAALPTAGTGGTTLGGGFSFTIHNGGTGAGSAPISWWVFMSPTPVPGSGSVLLASGSYAGPAIAPVVGTASVPLSWTWPSVLPPGGPRYLFIMISAADDLNPANNTYTSAAITLNPANVHYTVSGVTNTGGIAAGGPLAGQFTVQNSGADPGTYTANWKAYVSLDGSQTIDAGAILVSSGSISPLNGGASTTPVSFSGTWPAAHGLYFLKVQVSAPDEKSPDPVLPAAPPWGNTGVSTTFQTTTYVENDVQSVSAAATGVAGSPITASSFILENTGLAAGTQTITWQAYASTNATLDAGDTLVSSGTHAGMAVGSTSITITGNWPAGSSGTRFLIVEISSADDTNLANNVGVSGAGVTPVTVTAPDVKYRVTAVTNTPPSIAGGTINGNFTLNNFGSAGGSQSVFWTAYVSTDPTNTIDGSAKVVDSGTHTAVAAGGSPVQGFAGTWPATAGTYYLKVLITAADDLTSGDDIMASALVTTTVPDYDVPLVTNTGTSMAGRALSGTFTLHNGGSANGTKTVNWTAFASPNALLDASAIAVAAGTAGPLNAGTSQAGISFSGTWPSDSGSFFLLVKVAAADDMNPANDVGASGGVTVVAPDVNYSVTVVNNTGLLVSGGSLAGNFTLHNGGSVTGIQTVHWIVYASAGDAVIDVADTVVASGSVAALGSGGTQAGIGFTGTWPAAFGTYYLIVQVIAGDDQPPGGKTGASGALTVTHVDYAVNPVNLLTGTTAGAPFTADFTARNVGDANGSQNLYWSAYASFGNNQLDAGDTMVASGFIPGGLAAGGSQVVGFGGNWPFTAGNYNLIVSVSASDEQPGLLGNNQKASAPATSVVAPDVKYRVTAVTNTPPSTAGSTINGGFILNNFGTAGGTQTVYWTAYVSTDPTNTIDGSAKVVDSGTHATVAAGGSPVQSFAGTWPATAGTYYLKVSITAADDLTAGDDIMASAAVVTTAPDYDVPLVTNTGTSMAGRALSGTFTLHNGGAGNGTKTVNWTVFVSTDAVLDAGDTAVAAGTTGPLTAGTNLVGIPFSGTWPSAIGSFFLIVKAAAADDTNPVNDTGASGVVAVVAPDVNYSVTIVNNTGAKVAGGPLAGNFTLHNSGSVTGIQTVHWVVYASPGNAVIDGADTVVASGSVAALGSGGTQAGIGFTGTWPAAFGNYFLIVQVTAGDDQPPGGKTGASGALTVTHVDYAVTVVNLLAGTAAGAPFTANFTVRNNGDANGTQNLYWSAYTSPTPTLGAGGALVASNFISGGLASGTQQVVPFGGSWPSTVGNYYLIVSVSAADEGTSLIADDVNHTAAAIVVVPPNVDYTVVAGSVTGTMAPPVAPATPIAGTFQYKNQGLNNGSQWVSWTVYASPNPTLDSYAISIASGMAAPLNAGQTSGAIPFNGTWPLTYGNYYLLVWVEAQEDVNPGNNTDASVGTSPVGIYTGNGLKGTFNPWASFTDLTGVVLQPGMRIVVHTASMPSTQSDNTYRFNTGTANTFTAIWTVDVPMLGSAPQVPDMGLYYYTGPLVTNFDPQSYGVANINSIGITFTPDAPNAVRLLDLFNAQPITMTSYTLTISAN